MTATIAPEELALAYLGSALACGISPRQLSAGFYEREDDPTIGAVLTVSGGASGWHWRSGRPEDPQWGSGTGVYLTDLQIGISIQPYGGGQTIDIFSLPELVERLIGPPKPQQRSLFGDAA